MASCTFNSNGEAYAPNGASSLLYQDILEKTGDSQKAREVYAVTYTEEFKESVTRPLNHAEKSSIVKALKKINKSEVGANLKFKVVKTKGFQTIQTFYEGSQVGKIRLKPYLDGLALESVNLSPNVEKGLGIGTELYRAAILYSIKNNKSFYTDQNATPEAMRVREKFPFKQVEDGRFKAFAGESFFDKNREVQPKVLYKYLNNLDRDTNTTTQIDRNNLIDALFLNNSDINDSESLVKLLETAFYKDGIFEPSQESLEKSGLYSKFEIERILTDFELQLSIKATLERFSNSEISVQKEPSFKYSPVIKKSKALNNLGFREVENPSKTINEIIETVSESSEPLEALKSIENSVAQNILKNPKVLEEIVSFKKIKEFELNSEGELVEVEDSLLKTEVVELPKEDSDLMKDLNFLRNLSLATLTAKELKDFFKDQLELNAAKEGIDIIGIHLEENLNEIINPLRNFILNPNKTNQTLLEDSMRGVKKLDKQSKSRLVRVGQEDKSLVFIKNGNSVQEQMFEKGYLQTSNQNIFAKTDTTLPLDRIKEIYSFNKGVSIEEAKDFSNSEISQIEGVKSPDVASKIVLMKSLYGYDLQDKSNLLGTITTIKGDYKYLTEQFPSDFYKKVLTEKYKNSDDYKMFYSNFDVTEKGIEIVNKDSLTMEKIRDYLNQNKNENIVSNLYDYSSLSKNMENLNEGNTTMVDTLLNVVNNPSAVEEIQTGYTNINSQILRTQSKPTEFVKAKGNLYRLIETIQGNNFYKKIEVSNENSNYIFYPIDNPYTNLNLEKQVQVLKLQKDYKTNKPLYTKEELDKINDDNFAC